MVTSTHSKPARSKAEAISYWLLTPCSRRIATRGFARFRYGAHTRSLRSKRNVDEQARPVGVVEKSELLLCGLWVIAQRSDMEAGLGPHLVEGRAGVGVDKFFILMEFERVLRRGPADEIRSEAGGLELLQNSLGVFCADLEDCAKLFREKEFER